MSLQRSLQKGRQGDFSDHSTGRPQVGQVVFGAGIDTLEPVDQVQVQVVSRNAISSCVWTGRELMSFHSMKRMLQR